jgi:AraC family transcriptional regulator, regulatory protein of adaptative response / methylated-DNA-[protein]-cysteine methyltransferase
MLGMTPSAFRRGGVREEIRFAVGATTLGAILVASSDKGVAAILLGDDPDALARDLQDRFPRARLIGGDADFVAVVAEVVGFVEAPRVGLDLPLDVRGTAFQERVWQALRDIPLGETRTYSELAAAAGNPRAVRAAGQACATNPIAVIGPCHRVLAGDGLGGFGGGLDQKCALLALEGALLVA